ncbi:MULTISPECIES: GlsB/YeaQ/YmgE family stress response membrane protein [unclassified Novosphingobium]|uniref:GlsB/YeaQ/YmgE family stress response membrane protein n=1 Tax=unclassified Novosphingobium TaxID=2644732 RepID=UPI0025F3FC0E|nr:MULTISPECIES: GlsB/YeaQ/YmgE family stress response membrane protein [unclassified Novosphingobium]HQV04606.1 GlsB/YeaQ/YmgE family stress response membrane protein [Novosphingobium sp.]
MFNIIGALITGLLVGALARFLYPGAVEMGWGLTSLLGVGGALVASLFSSWSTGQSVREGFSRAGCLGSIVGAMLLIWLGRMLGWGF